MLCRVEGERGGRVRKMKRKEKNVEGRRKWRRKKTRKIRK